MGLSKRLTPCSVVWPQSPDTIISRVASEKAPSSTSNSQVDAVPANNQTSGAVHSSASIRRSVQLRPVQRASQANSAVFMPGFICMQLGKLVAVVSRRAAPVKVGAHQDFGQYAGHQKLQSAQHAEKP